MTKPDYKIEGEILEDAIAEQLRAIHSEYARRSKPGEFTVKLYAKINKCSEATGRTMLEKAILAGKIKARKVGNATYYRMGER